MEDTLCFTCRRACNGSCSWAKSFKPVKGWVAKPTKLRLYNTKKADSYHVEKCPKYVRDKREEINISGISKALHINLHTVYDSTISHINSIAKRKKVGFHIEVLQSVDNTIELVKVYD